ncbi:MAG: glycosyltransferase, partial [Limisphaerales bacterium]
LVLNGEELLLEETLRQVAATSAATTPVFLFSEASVMERVSSPVGLAVQKVETISPPTLGQIINALPGERAKDDLILLRPGTELPPSWDARLKWTAYSNSRIGIASPLCNEAPLFSALPENTRTLADLETYNRIAYWRGPKLTYEMPFYLAACAYIKRSALNQIPVEERDEALSSPWKTCYALSSLGFMNVLCNHLVVRSKAENIGVDGFPPSEEVEVTKIRRGHPLFSFRNQVAEKIKRKVQHKPIPGIKDGTVQLHLMHGWGGGLEHWVRSYCKADQKRKNLILKPAGNWGAFGEALLLYENVDAKEPIARWDFTRPIRGTAITHFEYKTALQEIIRKYGVDYIIVSSLIGHSLDALETGVDTAFVCHDFYPFCPAITIHFNQVCTSCDRERLASCFQQNEMNRFFKNLSVAEWLPLRKRFTELVQEHSIRFITPTDSVREHLVELQPALEVASFTTIAHGMDSRFPIRRQNRSNPGEKLRIVILGSLALQKGYNLFKASFRELLNYADIFLLGCGDEGMEFEMPGICVFRSYKQEELPGLLDKISPDCGLLLSIWPETFSYTLSELMQFGIPPIATNLGAFRNKIEHGTNGLLFEPSPECLLKIVRSLHADRCPLVKIEAELVRTAPRSLLDMVNDYHLLLPDKGFSPIRYENGDHRYEFSGTAKRSFRREFKKYVRQQIKTPTLLAMKRRVVRWMKISRTLPSR